jgi:hypothetical protein
MGTERTFVPTQVSLVPIVYYANLNTPTKKSTLEKLVIASHLPDPALTSP